MQYEIKFSGMITKIEPPAKEKAPTKITIFSEKATKYGTTETTVIFDSWLKTEAKVGDFVEIDADFKSREWQDKTYVSQVARVITVLEKAIAKNHESLNTDDEVPF